MKYPISLLVLLTLTFAAPAQAGLRLQGPIEQGALVIGHAAPGTHVTLDGSVLAVSPMGIFAFGFDRDHGPHARLVLTLPDDSTEIRELHVARRSFAIQRIEGVPPQFVNPPPEVLDRIMRESKRKLAAREHSSNNTAFMEPFIWPVSGRISGVFGSQRVYNGEPRRPHYGVDIAAAIGTPVVAPADGIVTLAEPDMYFEGGLIFIDHGQSVTSYYMHLSRVDVEQGQHIAKGQVVGAVGARGRATGPHLHWAMFWRDAHLDPSLLVPGVPSDGVTLGQRVK